MIKELICLIWGHRIWSKSYTGDVIGATTLIGQHIEIPLYRQKFNEICPRCGKQLMDNK